MVSGLGDTCLGRPALGRTWAVQGLVLSTAAQRPILLSRQAGIITLEKSSAPQGYGPGAAPWQVGSLPFYRKRGSMRLHFLGHRVVWMIRFRPGGPGSMTCTHRQPTSLCDHSEDHQHLSAAGLSECVLVKTMGLQGAQAVNSLPGPKECMCRAGDLGLALGEDACPLLSAL